MRKIIIEIETDSERRIGTLKQDLAQEISCCWNSFDVDKMKVSEALVHCATGATTTRESLGLKETETMCEKCTHEEICRREQCGEPYCVIRSCFDFEEKRPHGECKTCKHYVPYKEQFSYRNRGDGYCKSAITTSEGEAYINCSDEWYCANYEKEGDAK